MTRTVRARRGSEASCVPARAFLTADAVTAGLSAALQVGSTSPDVVAVEARKASPTATNRQRRRTKPLTAASRPGWCR